MRRFGQIVAVVGAFLVLVSILPGSGRGSAEATPQRKAATRLDRQLRNELRSARITPLDAGLLPSAEKVVLGQALFFDKELGGSRDIACATCHHPLFMTGDALSLSIGTGGIALGTARQLGLGSFIPRNAPEVFNRGAPQWRSQFWDSRVQVTKHGELTTPAGDALPPGLESVLAAQAMFPVTSRDEMRGFPGDSELGDLADADLQGIWDALMDRLFAFPEYRDMFAAAFPGVPEQAFGFEHAATAIAAFEIAAFTFLDSPFDRYMAGDHTAMNQAEKRGAMLFLGKAGCAKCHNGPLLTDQAHHNVGVPQLGPGKSPEAPLDFGRARETGKRNDSFRFRTPPLRNVAITGPWMHNGAYTTLRGAVEHLLDARRALRNYDPSQLRAELQALVSNDPATQQQVLRTLDGKMRRPVNLSGREIDDLMAFLNSLTSPSATDLTHTIPARVPSGLPVDGIQ